MVRFEPMIGILPQGESGDWKVRHIQVDETASVLTLIRSTKHPGAFVSPGSYAQLVRGRTIVMSDTDNERRTNTEVVVQARGRVLIAGLGLGMILVPILRKEAVASVTVIEASPDVVDLVKPSLDAWMARAGIQKEFLVVNADAREWKPPSGSTFDTIYFDIWDDICTDNLREIGQLKRRFSRRLNPGGWMGAWVEEDLRRHRRREKRQETAWRM